MEFFKRLKHFESGLRDNSSFLSAWDGAWHITSAYDAPSL